MGGRRSGVGALNGIPGVADCDGFEEADIWNRECPDRIGGDDAINIEGSA